ATIPTHPLPHSHPQLHPLRATTPLLSTILVATALLENTPLEKTLLEMTLLEMKGCAPLHASPSGLPPLASAVNQNPDSQPSFRRSSRKNGDISTKSPIVSCRSTRILFALRTEISPPLRRRPRSAIPPISRAAHGPATRLIKLRSPARSPFSGIARASLISANQ